MGFGEERPWPDMASQMVVSRWCCTVFRLHLSSSRRTWIVEYRLLTSVSSG